MNSYTDKTPGFRLSPLGEKMRTDGSCLNPCVSLTEIVKEKKASSPNCLMQSWMRSGATVEYLRMGEKTYNPKFQDNACDELVQWYRGFYHDRHNGEKTKP